VYYCWRRDFTTPSGGRAATQVGSELSGGGGAVKKVRMKKEKREGPASGLRRENRVEKKKNAKGKKKKKKKKNISGVRGRKTDRTSFNPRRRIFLEVGCSCYVPSFSNVLHLRGLSSGKGFQSELGEGGGYSNGIAK